MLLHRCRPTARPVIEIVKYGLAALVVLAAAATIAFSLWDVLGIVEGFVFAAAAAGLLYAGWTKLRYDSTSIEVTDRDITMRSGMLNKSDQLIPLSRVQDTLVKRTMIESWFKVGHLYVSTAGGIGYELEARNLDDADIAKILDVIKYFKEGGPRPAPHQPPEQEAAARRPPEPSPFLPEEAKKPAQPAKEMMEIAEKEKERADVLGEELLKEVHGKEGKAAGRRRKHKKR